MDIVAKVRELLSEERGTAQRSFLPEEDRETVFALRDGQGEVTATVTNIRVQNVGQQSDGRIGALVAAHTEEGDFARIISWEVGSTPVIDWWGKMN